VRSLFSRTDENEVRRRDEVDLPLFIPAPHLFLALLAPFPRSACEDRTSVQFRCYQQTFSSICLLRFLSLHFWKWRIHILELLVDQTLVLHLEPTAFWCNACMAMRWTRSRRGVERRGECSEDLIVITGASFEIPGSGKQMVEI
jgi:hypothetical protein